MRVLADKGANLDLANKYEATPVYAAAYDGHHKVVRLLIEKGANIFIPDKQKRTPLEIARTNPLTKDHKPVVRILKAREERNIHEITTLFKKLRGRIGNQMAIRTLRLQGPNSEKLWFLKPEGALEMAKRESSRSKDLLG